MSATNRPQGNANDPDLDLMTRIAPAAEPRFAVCVCNDGFPAALELHRIYRMLPDAQGERHGLVRIVDESGEAYLYPEEYFIPAELAADPQQELLRAS
jgi:hypothetical protein